MKLPFFIGNLSGALIACVVLWPQGGEDKKQAPPVDSERPAKQRTLSEVTRHLDPEWLDPAATKYQSRSMVGTWAHALCVRGDGPTHIRVVQINEDGTFHQLDIETLLDRSKETGDEEHYIPTGVELVNHTRGTIDQVTGEQIGSKTATEGGVTWSAVDGKLHWDMDMGAMGGQGLDFYRVR